MVFLDRVYPYFLIFLKFFPVLLILSFSLILFTIASPKYYNNESSFHMQPATIDFEDFFLENNFTSGLPDGLYTGVVSSYSVFLQNNRFVCSYDVDAFAEDEFVASLQVSSFTSNYCPSYKPDFVTVSVATGVAQVYFI
jgi:hypothetical protein